MPKRAEVKLKVLTVPRGSSDANSLAVNDDQTAWKAAVIR